MKEIVTWYIYIWFIQLDGKRWRENISRDLSVDEKEEEEKGSGRMRIGIANMDVIGRGRERFSKREWLELWWWSWVNTSGIVITRWNIFDMFTQRREEKKNFASSSLTIFSHPFSLHQFSSSFIVVPKGGCLNPDHNNWAKNIVGIEREREIVREEENHHDDSRKGKNMNKGNKDFHLSPHLSQHPD